MKKVVFILFILTGIFLAPFCMAQKIGGGNLNPGIYTNEESIEKFQDLRVGLSIHWGPSSLGGKEISWSRDKEIPKETYDNFYKTFNPTQFNAREWTELAKEGGMKYILSTSKHHDGFCLWPSKFSDYNISNTPFKSDIVRALSDACKQDGIVFGSYYSIIDWYHPDYQPYGHGGPGELDKPSGDSPNFERYLIYMKNQLRELVVDYGAEIIQLDGDWDSTWNHQIGSDMYLYLRKLNDRLLISSRIDIGRWKGTWGTWNTTVYAGDYEERERMNNDLKDYEFGKSDIPWQAWVTIDKNQWSYNETPRLRSADSIIIDLLNTVGNNGNYLINVAPRPDGTFDPIQVAIVKQVGNWLKKYGEGIYSTRGGPFSLENSYKSTIKNKTIYLFILNNSIEKVELKTEAYEISKVSNFDNSEIKYKLKGGLLAINLPVSKDEKIRVIKITTK
jgi:alpha-L-fucosidase